MANYAALKAAIQQVIKTNGSNEITGALLQQSLLSMINSLGVGYQFVGIATPSTNPGTPDQNVFYIASTAGTYANFGGLVLADGEIAILKYNGAWSKDSTGAASLETVNQLVQNVDKEIGQNTLFDGDVDYSAQGYNRFLVNMVELPMPSKDVILETINTTDCKIAVELYYTDETRTTILKGGNVLMAFHEAKNIYKVRAFFQTADQPIGYVKINVFTKPSVYWDIVNNFIIEQKDKSNTNNDLRWKADIDVGVNLVNPVFVESGKYFKTNGEIATTTIQNYKISGYIPVNGQNIICNGDNASNTSTFVVYDKDYNQLRTQVNSGKQYNYQDGDCYVRITFATSGTCYANYGTTLSQVAFTKYAHYDSLRNELDTKFASVPIENIINGIKTVCVNANEMNAGNPVYYEAIDIDSFLYKSLATTAQVWCASKVFQPDLSLPIRIKARAKLLQGTERKINLWVSPTIAYDSQRTVSYHSFTFPEGVNEMDIEFSFDPQYFIVYKNFTTDFSIWLQSKGDGTTATHIQYDDFAIFQKVGEQVFNNFSGEDLLELLHSIDNALETDVETTDNESIKVAPNGGKFVLQVSNNGDLITIPVIPSKAYFFGNSLLSGNAFGMAASDQYKDYYYLINSFILSKIPSYSSGKNSCSTFEQASTIEAARAQIQSLVANLTGDEKAVFVQIGDNVSQANLTVFSTSFKEFILAIRNACQTARIIIFGCWYSIPARIEILSRVAKETGSLFINITDLNIISNQSYIGAIQLRTYSATWTLENVTSVVDNGEVHSGYAHNITVAFTVSGSSYTATVDCAAYSLDGTTLQYTSDYYIIPNKGIGSHPGDAGFKAITNRILYKTGMVEVENYYN
jgi:hypothetical protein